MPLDGFITNYLSIELNAALSGARINKIYQPALRKILFELYAPALGTAQFVFNCESAFAYAGFTDLSYDNPKIPPPFACCCANIWPAERFCPSVKTTTIAF